MAQRLGSFTLLSKRITTQYLGKMSKVTLQAEKLKSGNPLEGHELYNPKLLKKNYGIIPLLVIVFGGIFVLSGFIYRNTVTRDDVRFHTRGQFGYEKEENFDKRRKFLVFNQKFNAPEGLKELYEELEPKK